MKVWLEKFRKEFFYKRLKKQLKAVKIDRKSISFSRAKTVGIILEATNRENQVFVDKYRDQLRQKGKRVKVLAYFDDRETHENYLFDYFTNKELSWFYQPQGTTVDDFMNEKFDILISLHLHRSPPLEYIAAMSKANMRVGYYREDAEEYYDLMIDAGEELDLDNYTNQIDHYLTIINKDE